MDSQQCRNRSERLTLKVPGWLGSDDESCMKQQTLAMAANPNAQYEQYQHRKPTRREVFLTTIAQGGLLDHAATCSFMGRERRMSCAVAPLKQVRQQVVHGDSAHTRQQAQIELKALRACDEANRKVRKFRGLRFGLQWLVQR